MRTSDHIERIFNEAFKSMPHEFSSKIFAKKTRELGLPKTSHVKNMRTEYLKNKSVRVKRFNYKKECSTHTHLIEYKFNNKCRNDEFDKVIKLKRITVDDIVNIIKIFSNEEIKSMANKLGWKIQVKVETWNEI